MALVVSDLLKRYMSFFAIFEGEIPKYTVLMLDSTPLLHLSLCSDPACKYESF